MTISLVSAQLGILLDTLTTGYLANSIGTSFETDQMIRNLLGWNIAAWYLLNVVEMIFLGIAIPYLTLRVRLEGPASLTLLFALGYVGVSRMSAGIGNMVYLSLLPK